MSLMELTQVLGNVGEFVGAIGVVATLLFLAVQVRHSKQSMDANTEALEQSRLVLPGDQVDGLRDRVHR